ncbi:MAG: SurA N-terminal domain-containing protein [Panacagrimonas sp.]
MLQSIRDRLQGPVIWFVIGLIAIPFAFWGIDSFRSGGGDPVVAKIGGEDITQAEFRQGYESRYQQYRSLLGENFRADLFDQGRFRQMILDDMIQESAMRQHAKDSGYRAGDATLRDFLVSIPAFQKDGQFSAETYKQLLQRQNLAPERYETQVRESLVIDQLRNAVQETAFVTAADTWESARLDGQKRRISVVLVEGTPFREKVEVREDQIASRYDIDKTRYMSPERIKLAYIELDRSKLVPAEAPPPEALKAIYDAEKDARFTSTEERKARHILVNFGADKDAAQKKAEDLAAQIKAGADFAKLAAAHSDDTGSKAQGGDLGWVRKGMMAPRFEETLFGLQAGGVAGPVETEFGWHVIQLDEVKAVATKAFEEAQVQEELLEVYRTREADKRFQEISAKLEDLAFEKPDLEAVAKDLGLSVATTDWFARAGGPGLASVAAVREAAYSPEVLTDNQNSKPISTGSDTLVVVHKSEYEAARQRPLEEVREQVREAVLVEGASKLAKESAEALLASVKGGESLAAAATAKGFKPSFEGEAGRKQAEVEALALQAAFKLPRPAAGKTEATLVEVGSGSMAVVALAEVVDPVKPAEPDEKAKTEQKNLRDSLAGAELGAYRKSVESAVKVKILNPPTEEPAAQAPEF